MSKWENKHFHFRGKKCIFCKKARMWPLFTGETFTLFQTSKWIPNCVIYHKLWSSNMLVCVHGVNLIKIINLWGLVLNGEEWEKHLKLNLNRSRPLKQVIKILPTTHIWPSCLQTDSVFRWTRPRTLTRLLLCADDTRLWVQLWMTWI